MTAFDGADRLKDFGSGLDGVPELENLIGASFCCRAEILRLSSWGTCNSFDLVSWGLGPVSTGPNNGEVSNEKIGGVVGVAFAGSNILFGFEGTAASVEVGNSSVTAFVCPWVVVVGNVVEGCPNVVFLSINRVDDEGTVPLLLSPVLGPNCEGEKLALGTSLLSKTLPGPLDSLALVPLSDGKKLNLGGSLLSKTLGAV